MKRFQAGLFAGLASILCLVWVFTLAEIQIHWGARAANGFLIITILLVVAFWFTFLTVWNGE